MQYSVNRVAFFIMMFGLQQSFAVQEPVPSKAKAGQDGALGDAVEKGALLAQKAVTTGIDSALESVERYEKKQPCPKRKVAGVLAAASADLARAESIAALARGQRVPFDDETDWIVDHNQYLSPQQRLFQMRTVTYKKATEVLGFPLWYSKIQERWRQGINNKQKASSGFKTTFRKLDREITPYGYCAIAGITLLSLKLVWKIVS